jgi:hypothetical protein
MRIGLSHSRYIANRVALELNREDFVKFSRGIDVVIEETEKIIFQNIKNEQALEERTRELIEDYEEDIEHQFADEKELFKMIKRKLAPQYGFIMNYEERFSDLAYTIHKHLLEMELITYRVNDVRVKSLIFEAIEDYIDERFDVEDRVLEKLKNYKRKLIPGTDDYQIVYNKLYEDELRRSGGMR